MNVAFSFWAGILEVVAENAITLYRPVGQPIFYPVLNEPYAVQIARDWNTKDERSGYAGYVLRFKVKSSFLDNYEVHTAGSSEHREYWIPAADLDQFNENIV